MAAKECMFEIKAAGGGDLEGDMFGRTTGRLSKRQEARDVNELRVTVLWKAGGTAPDALMGRFMFSAAPTASKGQTAASPFKDGTGRQLCYTEITTGRVKDTNPVAYTFPDFHVHPMADEGKYELTFVAQDPDGIQWSEDPEFDIES